MTDPVIDFLLEGQEARTVACAKAPCGLVLIAMVGEDTYHVVEQRPDGTMIHRLGPITPDDALEAVTRVLGGRETSVTGDGMAAVAGLVGIAAKGGAL